MSILVITSVSIFILALVIMGLGATGAFFSATETFIDNIFIPENVCVSVGAYYAVI